MINWGINIHNLVNRDTGKRRFSFKESDKIYLNKINYILIFNLMKYYSDWSLRDIYAIKKFKKIVKFIITFFPCKKWKERLKIWFDKNVNSCNNLFKINKQINYLCKMQNYNI